MRSAIRRLPRARSACFRRIAKDPPARTRVGVRRLAEPEMLVEIEAIA